MSDRLLRCPAAVLSACRAVRLACYPAAALPGSLSHRASMFCEILRTARSASPSVALGKRIIGTMSTQTDESDQMLVLLEGNEVTPEPPTTKGRLGRILMIVLAAVTFVSVGAYAVYLVLVGVIFTAFATAGH